MELREQVGIGLAVQLAPVDELPRAYVIDFDVAQLYGFPRTDQLVNRQYRPQNYGELLTEFYMEVCGPPKEYYSPR